MTWILVLLCLAIAGRELYLAYERKRPPVPPELTELRVLLEDTREEVERLGFGRDRPSPAKPGGGPGGPGGLGGPDGADGADGADPAAGQDTGEGPVERLTTEQARLAASLGETDARIRSLITQINERMLPEINTRLARQGDAIDRLGSEVAELRGHLVSRLDQAVAASLGADPVDTVAGALAADAPDPRADLSHAFERFTGRYGLRIELADPTAYRAPGSADAWQIRYYLTGRDPRALERDFIDLLNVLDGAAASAPVPDGAETGIGTGPGAGAGTGDAGDTKIDAAQTLLKALENTHMGGAQIGPLVIARTPHTLVCGVLPLADLQRAEPASRLADPITTVAKIRSLPSGRRFTPSSASA